MDNHSQGPLHDVTVVDLTVALAGPVATLLLAGLGARVIKVEQPNAGDPCRNNPPYLGRAGVKLTREAEDDISLSVLNRLRNKLGITLNLKHPGSRAVFADLVRKADLVVENFSPGTLDRLGIGYPFGREINPRIVYCSISGFGSDAPPDSGKALDTVIQALSGIMYVSGETDDPPARVGITIADLTAAQFGVIGALSALHQARQSGQGQHVDVSMLGALTAMVASENFEALERCGAPVRTGQTVQRLAPFGTHRASDGYVAICAYTDPFAHALFMAMGRPDLCTDARFMTRDQRVRNYRELDVLIGEWTSVHPLSEIVSTLRARGIPAAEVRHPAAAVRDAQVLARGETVPLTHPQYGAVDEIYGMGIPIRFSGASPSLAGPPPELGQHNETVYREILGYGEEHISKLRMEGVI
jgi:CoA:oxalate CoA-transferase